MKKIYFLLLALFPFVVYAKDITKEVEIRIDGEVPYRQILDDNEATYLKITKNSIITINYENNINGIYIVYEYSSQKGLIEANSSKINVGENGFLHEYIPIKEKIGDVNSLSLVYEEDVKVADIYVFDEDKLPDFVEVWNPPCDSADLMLISTHSDDEQLFFLGLLPTYIARGADVQVVYFTNHYSTPKRLHEQLHGLYTVGVKNYPIIGIVPDAWSTNLNDALNNAKKNGLSEDDLISYIVEIIRRFKPQVIVDHDENGEYEHGQHMLNTYILEKALLKTNDKTYNIDTYNKYGLWEVPKVYLHLYPKNKIIMNYDIPLEYFNGKTAYEVSKEGYSKHLSQQYTWFTAWINGNKNEFTKSTDIKTYSPNEFGLYSSLVGEDINKNDMFENIVLRKDIPIVEIEEDTSVNIVDNKNDIIKYRPYIIIVTSLAGIILIILLLRKKH